MQSLKLQLAKLKTVLANQQMIEFGTPGDPFEAIVKQAGFASLEEAKHVAAIFKAKTGEYALLSGRLRTNWDKRRYIKEQLPSGKVVLEFSNKKDLGRMRALVRLVALENGYKALFRMVKGQPVFEKEYLNPAIRDDYGSMYSVKVAPLEKPKEKALFALSDADRKRLLAMV